MSKGWACEHRGKPTAVEGWKTLDRVVDIRIASPSIARNSANSFTTLLTLSTETIWSLASPGYVSQAVESGLFAVPWLIWTPQGTAVHTCTWFHCDLTFTTSPSPVQKTHVHPRFKCSVHLDGSGASFVVEHHDETWSEIWRQTA